MDHQTAKQHTRLTQEQMLILIATRSDKEIAAEIRKLATLGRPKTLIDYDQAARLAMMGCTLEEIAADAGITKSTILNRLKDDKKLKTILEVGRARGRVMLRSVGMKKALAGDNCMLVWKGKQILGERDNVEFTGAEGGPIRVEHSFKPDYSKLTTEQLKALVEIKRALMPPAEPAVQPQASQPPTNGFHADVVIDVEPERAA